MYAIIFFVQSEILSVQSPRVDQYLSIFGNIFFCPIRKVSYLKMHYVQCECTIMKRNFKQWLSTVPPISTKRTTNKQMKTKKPTTYGVRNADPDWEQAPYYWGVWVEELICFLFLFCCSFVP